MLRQPREEPDQDSGSVGDLKCTEAGRHGGPAVRTSATVQATCEAAGSLPDAGACVKKELGHPPAQDVQQNTIPERCPRHQRQGPRG